MKPRAFVGLDVHRNLVVATALDPTGKRIRQKSFGPTSKELVGFLRRLPKPTKVVLESCLVWERFYEAAISSGAEVVVSHPRTTRMIAEASLKTDKVDSATLANLLRLNAVPTVFVQSPEDRARKHLFSDHQFLVGIRTRLMEHAYSRIGRLGIDYAPGQLQRRTTREKLRKLHNLEIDHALDALNDLDARCQHLEERLHEEYLRSRPAQLLTTIPGIGEVTAVGIASNLNPIERFHSAERLTSYAGLCPTTHQSSGTSYHGPLKPDCSRKLRKLLVQVSWRHRIHEPKGDVAKLAKRVGKRKGRMHGTVVGAHKLLRIIYAMLKQDRPYQLRAPESAVA